MMQADAIFSERCHPVLLNHNWTVQRILKPLPRSTAHVRYLYIDYGISTYIAPGKPLKLVTGVRGHVKDVPELSMDVPYNPYKVDIYIIGSTLRTLFLDVRPASLLCFRMFVSCQCRTEICKCRISRTVSSKNDDSQASQTRRRSSCARNMV